MDDIDTFTEYSELLSLVSSNDWKQFLKVLEKRKQYLQNKVNEYVRGQDLYNAYATLAVKDSIDKTIEILFKRLNELEQKGEK